MENINENLTKSKILASALEIFLEKGFAGASISMIAKHANINQSLIYHHFKNKQDLWDAVKNNFIKQRSVKLDLSVNKSTDIREFFKNYIEQRFNFYINNPESIKMMNWQRLEAESLKSRSNIFGFQKLVEALQQLQIYKKILSEYNPEYIAIYMSTSVTAPLFDYLQYFHENLNYQAEFQRMILDNFMKNFAL